MSALALRMAVMAALFCAASAGLAADGKRRPQDVFDGMRESFRPDKAAGVHVRYQFTLTGAHGGDWWIEVRESKASIARGRIENPDVTMIASDDDWVALSDGKLSGRWAFLTGRLKIRGNRGVAKKLGEMFH